MIRRERGLVGTLIIFCWMFCSGVRVCVLFEGGSVRVVVLVVGSFGGWDFDLFVGAFCCCDCLVVWRLEDFCRSYLLGAL